MGVGNLQLGSNYLTRLCIHPGIQTHCQKLVLSCKMNYIADTKRACYDAFRNRMRRRIDKAAEDSLEVIRSIPYKDGIPWTREALMRQAKRKREDLLLC